MIARINGRIVENERDELVVDVGGIGYRVTVGGNLAMKRGFQIGENIELAVFTIVRADEIRLIGLEDGVSRRIFGMLLGVSGVGPKAALHLIDEIGPKMIIQAINDDNLTALVKVAGIGKKIAQRILIELKEKIRQLPEWAEFAWTEKKNKAGEKDEPENWKDDVTSALKNLGFGDREIEKTLKRHFKNSTSLDDVLRKCLADLRKIS
jgi:holliday junction DNA helicase RuvA